VEDFGGLGRVLKEEAMPAKNPHPWWKCSECGYVFQAAPPPPETCPSCNEKCVFVDVTCYTPECGPGTPDPQLMNTPKSDRVRTK
jgi:rubredoxin